VLLLAGSSGFCRHTTVVSDPNLFDCRGPVRGTGWFRGRGGVRNRLDVRAILADALCRGKPLPRPVRMAGGAAALQASGLGVRVRVFYHVGLRSAALSLEDRDDSARGSLATGTVVHRLHLAGADADRLGLRPIRSARIAAALVFPLDRSPGYVARGLSL